MDSSAASSCLGYLFQCRYALLECLGRLRRNDEFAVSIEALDDVVFETRGQAPELLQTKHHLKRAADLTDASPDLWKTIRIWGEALASGSIPDGSSLFLITTSQAAFGSAGHYLKPGPSRDVGKAVERLAATVDSSTSTGNAPAYSTFRELSETQRLALAEAILVIDGVPAITDLDSALREQVFFAALRCHLDSFLERLEGWWIRRAIGHLAGSGSAPVLSEELEAEMARLREQFKEDNLPIDDEIMQQSVDASGYEDKTFVHQLHLIKIGNPRILRAIRNYFRAFEQRSRWIREDLLLVGELGRYEDQLTEEWDALFEQMRDELDDSATEEAKTRAAQTLYKWVETNMHRPIRQGVSEPSIARGTYHMLADGWKVGWHPDFAERLKQLLEVREA